ncbi:Acyl-CoA synthetase (AMP-forming)/AMP-acid ligase II [Ekhidna lutea]|uniref:Acyl-CoA synthetase (AMP-forming)/AMP-acid ligase II n=1 Tax=Ekhidna lutea TaxID=447679 RepID=A0A239GZB8_EKHLU|nr:AMP-binding protein [Ekhidna lutea]SNS74242.1 Acyl-CoA synthetase (AMP-forming)/AMP-acid ligase II [Ekhidna lutea]
MLPPLICPNCSNDFAYSSSSKEFDQTDSVIKCNHCQTVVPVVNGIVYYTEKEIAYHSDERSFLDYFRNRIEQKRDEYLKFISNKISRKLIDPYSAFQPFNESSRSFCPFISDLKSKLLEPGDLILDTWCRTGWTGYFLASLFPEQTIVSVWEGNKDVLGYAGFDYWLNNCKRPENLMFLHLDINKQLPFADNTFKVIYGLDTLHRYDQTSLVSELLRITQDDGALIFPHIHLTNSEPDPFFERGEKQLHGTEWARFFEKRLTNTSWKSYVLSEPQLFDLKVSKEIESKPNTSDYNGLIALLPEDISWNIAPYKPELEDNDRIIVNPYLTIDLNRGKVNVDENYLNGAVGKMLERHPIYRKRVEHLIEYPLSSQEVQVLYLAQHNYTIAEIEDKLRISSDLLVQILDRLLDSEIIHVLPLTEEAVNLQLFHSAIPFLPSKKQQTFYHQRQGLYKQSEKPVIVDLAEGSELAIEDVTYLTSSIKSRFIDNNVGRGDCVFICSKPHFEALLILWSALELGIEVSVVSTEIPLETRIELFNERDAKYLFLDSITFLQSREKIDDVIAVVLDNENDQIPDEKYFSNWLESGPEDPIDQTSIPEPDDIAVTLYSSGSTGKPKGIQLSQETLFKSGKVFAETYGWNPSDRLVMVTELDSMSGLRNIAIATSFSGTTIVIPSFSGPNNILSIIQGIEESKATLLTCTPALIKQFNSLGERIQNSLKSLRQVLCTGVNLSPTLVTQFENLFNIRILNYYGLTETSGLCIGETPESTSNVGEVSIGIPVDSISQIVDSEDNVIESGNVGRLRIFNDRLMSGYLRKDNKSDLTIKNGWLYTGDLAVQDSMGNFFLKGRERNIIKDDSGNVVYLSEVEDTLLSHPDILDVEVSKLDHEEAESILASILLKKDTKARAEVETDIKSFVRKKIGNSKVPIIEFVNALTRNGRGNVELKNPKLTV